MSDRYRSIVDVHLMLRRDGHVLLARRAPGIYAGGLLHLPSGHLEARENVADACAREAREEVGIALQSEELRLRLTMHHRNPSGEARIGLFFEPTSWSGEPCNMEPDKCTGIGWYDADALPDDLVPYTSSALQAIRRGQQFALDGWTTAPT